MEAQIDYLRAKLLWEHLKKLSIATSDISEEISEGVAFATAMSLLQDSDNTQGNPTRSVGGVTSSDIMRYGLRPRRFEEPVMNALLKTIEGTLNDVNLYFWAAKDEQLDEAELHALTLSLDRDVQDNITCNHLDLQELLSRLETVINLYQDVTEAHTHLHATLHETMETLPAVINANHAASNDLLALTVETSLLKLSVVRARLKTSLYDYATPSNSGVTISRVVDQLHGKFTAHQLALDAQQREVQRPLKDYHQLLELVDGHGSGFAQVVEDLATVNRETEECRKDLRRLGWTEG